MISIRRVASLALARLTSLSVLIWRKDRFYYSPEEWRQIKISYSDHGEDLVILDYLKQNGTNQRGIYVDVGAFDPVLISNTMLLYKHGWHGIIIDANPAVISRFKKIRPRDTAVLAAVSDSNQDYIYYEYRLPGNNRLALVESDDNQSMIGETPLSQTRVNSLTLDDIICSHTEAGCVKIDLLSIDVEGFDLMALKGLDIDRFKPSLICVEVNGRLSERLDSFQSYLSNHGYEMLACFPLNLIFYRLPSFNS